MKNVNNCDQTSCNIKYNCFYTFVSTKAHLKSSSTLYTTRMKFYVEFRTSRHYNYRIRVTLASLIRINGVRVFIFSNDKIICTWNVKRKRESWNKEKRCMISYCINCPFTCNSRRIRIWKIWG